MAEIKFSYNNKYNNNTLKDCNQKNDSYQIKKSLSLKCLQRKVDGGDRKNT